jgi:chromosome segregation ATPase
VSTVHSFPNNVTDRSFDTSTESIKEQSETQEELITDLGADIDDLNARNEHLTRALEDSKIALQDEKRAWREEERRKEAEMAKLLVRTLSTAAYISRTFMPPRTETATPNRQRSTRSKVNDKRRWPRW